MNKDLYFDTTDINTQQENFKRGDTVKMYKEQESFNYPALILKAEEIHAYTVNAMKGILQGKSLVSSETPIYHLYIELPQQVVGVGVIEARQLKFILSAKMFKKFDKVVMVDSNTKIEGDMLYALCII